MVMFQMYLVFLIIPNCLTTTCPSQGTFYEKYSGKANVFESHSEFSKSMVKCSAACLQSQPHCIGFKYEENKLCELIDVVIRGSPSKESEEMWISETWIAGNQSHIEIKN